MTPVDNVIGCGLRSAVVKLIVLVTAAALLLLAGCSSGKHAAKVAGARTDPLAVARTLGVCTSPESFSATVARCAFADGSIAVGVIPTAAEQAYAGSVADSSASGCDLIGDGWQIQAALAVLEAHLDVSSIRAKYGATLHGPC